MHIHPRVSLLAKLLREHRAEIVRRWRSEVTATVSSESLPKSELIDSLPDFLEELAGALTQNEDRPIDEPLAPRSDTAVKHGMQRFRMGFDVATVVREYAILQDVIFSLAETGGLQIGTHEHRMLSRYLFSAVGDSVTQYAVERDEELKRQTSRHVGFLAHELRNPLASARLALDILKRKGGAPDSRPFRTLDRSLVRLTTLIDRSLVDVRLRATGELLVEEIRLPDLFEELASESFVEDDLRKLELTVEVAPHVVLEADRKLLYSATSNLLRNALKFTKPGGKIHLRGKDGNGRVVIEVEDGCGGLPDGDVQKLFDPFVQIGQDRSGFGLGLAIAEQAAHAHGGTIRVHNVPGKGCIFVLDLPERRASPSGGQA